jgi:hypothetical protein
MLKRSALISIMVMAVFGAVHAQSSAPEVATRDFYRWYIGELNADRYPIDKNKREIRKHVSVRLARWLFSPAYREYGADYFLDAQDFDAEWARTVQASGGVIKGSTATAVLTFPKSKNFDRKVVSISLVREAGAWKIDKVRGRIPKT